MTELEQARQIISETDREMAKLFERRMDAVRQVAAYKRRHGLPIEDAAREEEVIARALPEISCAEYRPHFAALLRCMMEGAKALQRSWLEQS